MPLIHCLCQLVRWWLSIINMGENQAPPEALLAFRVKQRRGNMSRGSHVGVLRLQGAVSAASGCRYRHSALQLHQLCGLWRLGREAQVRVVSWAVSSLVCWMASEEQSHLPALVTFSYVPCKLLHLLSPCPASLSQLLLVWTGIQLECSLLLFLQCPSRIRTEVIVHNSLSLLRWLNRGGWYFSPVTHGWP